MAKTKATQKITVTQLKSTIGFNKTQAVVLKSLGLRRIRHTIEVPDTVANRGMLRKVRHLVHVEGEK